MWSGRQLRTNRKRKNAKWFPSPMHVFSHTQSVNRQVSQARLVASALLLQFRERGSMERVWFPLTVVEARDAHVAHGAVLGASKPVDERVGVPMISSGTRRCASTPTRKGNRRRRTWWFYRSHSFDPPRTAHGRTRSCQRTRAYLQVFCNSTTLVPSADIGKPSRTKCSISNVLGRRIPGGAVEAARKLKSAVRTTTKLK